MQITNILLKVVSVLITAAIVHQMFASRDGVPLHRIVGNISMWLGVILAIVVAVRGLSQNTFGSLYSVHLVTGFIFFLAFFMTGFLGYKTRKDKKHLGKHKFFAWLTSLSVATTLILGIFSVLSH